MVTQILSRQNYSTASLWSFGSSKLRSALGIRLYSKNRVSLLNDSAGQDERRAEQAAAFGNRKGTTAGSQKLNIGHKIHGQREKELSL
jgi:hypothetical protein